MGTLGRDGEGEGTLGRDQVNEGVTRKAYGMSTLVD